MRVRRLQLALDRLRIPELSRLSSVKASHVKLMKVRRRWRYKQVNASTRITYLVAVYFLYIAYSELHDRVGPERFTRRAPASSDSCPRFRPPLFCCPYGYVLVSCCCVVVLLILFLGFCYVQVSYVVFVNIVSFCVLFFHIILFSARRA